MLMDGVCEGTKTLQLMLDLVVVPMILPKSNGIES